MNSSKVNPKMYSSVDLINKKTLSSENNKSNKQNNSIHHNPEHHNQIDMQTIFEANKEYLMQKIKISQVPTPSKYYRKMPSRTPNTTYNKQFQKNFCNSINQIKVQRKDNLFTSKKTVTGYDTLYKNQFNKTELDKNNNPQRSKSIASTNIRQDLIKRQQQKEKNVFLRNQAPVFHDTSYGLDYAGNYNVIPAQSAKRGQNKLMGGGAFKGESTYHGVYKNHNQKRSQPIYQTNNKLFVTLNSPFQSTYEKEFNKKLLTIQPNGQSKRAKMITSGQSMTSRENRSSKPSVNEDQQKMRKSSNQFGNKNYVQSIKNGQIKEIQRKKYKTEYERSFKADDSTKNKGKNISLMTLEAMKKMILSVL